MGKLELEEVWNSWWEGLHDEQDDETDDCSVVVNQTSKGSLINALSLLGGEFSLKEILIYLEHHWAIITATTETADDNNGVDFKRYITRFNCIVSIQSYILHSITLLVGWLLC